MTDLQPLVALTFDSLANLLASAPEKTWDAPSLCENWQVRHVIAHVTMPARLTPEQFATEMAAAEEISPCSPTPSLRAMHSWRSPTTSRRYDPSCCASGKLRAAAQPMP